MMDRFSTKQGRDILIRECKGFDELDACVQLQIDVWGYSDGDVIPRRVFTVTQKIGGQVIGAFDVTDDKPASSDSLIGFALALPAVRPGSLPDPYLHSHMLAVRSGYRDAGVGRRLKLAQRSEALERGFRLMEWTFDPLEIKNAFLNIHRLGVIVRRYTPNFYGVSSSRLQGGLPTDRLHAEWWMQSERVTAILAGAPQGAADVSLLPRAAIEQTIVVPHAIGKWKSSLEDQDRERALSIQSENRQLFQKAFDQGLAVIGFTTDSKGNGTFELGAWREPVPQNH